MMLREPRNIRFAMNHPNQSANGKKIPIALPIGTEARQSLPFPRRILLAVLALFTAFSMGMDSNLSAAETAATSQGSLVTKQYTASSELLASLRKASPANASAPLTEVFESLGVPFPEGALAQVPPGGALIVRNTKENMELVDALIEAHSGKAGGSH
jgi:hypothetical protein